MELIVVCVHRMILWAKKVLRDLEWWLRWRCPACTRYKVGRMPCTWRDEKRVVYFR